MPELCPEERLLALTQDMQSGAPNPMERVEKLLAEFPDDPRLNFLRGSMLITDGRLIEAHRAMTRAVELAPDFAIARFQLGFFQLTSGEAGNALETWGGSTSCRTGIICAASSMASAASSATIFRESSCICARASASTTKTCRLAATCSSSSTAASR